MTINSAAILHLSRIRDKSIYGLKRVISHFISNSKDRLKVIVIRYR